MLTDVFVALYVKILLIEVEKLAKAQKFDYLIIESTGISEPIPVAQTFSFESEDGSIDLTNFYVEKQFYKRFFKSRVFNG